MTVISEEVRPGWTSVKLGRAFDRIQDVGYPELPLLSVFLDDGVVPRADRSDNYNALGSDLAKYQLVLPDDIVFNKLRTWQGGFGISRYQGIISPAYIICRPRDRALEPRFVHHLLRSDPYLAEFKRLSKWMPPSQFDIGWSEIREVKLAVPSLDEQRRIADFLDDQVARIDNIIAARHDQQHLLGTFVATTRANVMGGGVVGLALHPVLGEINREYPVLRLNRAVRRVGVGVVVEPSSYFVEDGVPFLHGGNVREESIDLSSVKRISKENSERMWRSRLSPGDVVVVRAGYPGRAAVVPDELDGANCASVLVIKTLAEVAKPAWIELFFNSPQGKSQVGLAQYGAAQEQINVGHVVDFLVPIPPIDVQARLLEDYQRKRDEAEKASAALDRQTTLLGQMKRSVITAAVAGKFDVSAADGSRVSV